MNKKWLLSIGSIGAIVAPLATVVSCFGDDDDDEDDKDQNQNGTGTTPGNGTGTTPGNGTGTTPGTGTQPGTVSQGAVTWPTNGTTGDYTGLTSIKDSATLASEAYTYQASVEVTQDAVDGVDAIIAEMNKEADISWHTIGEPMVDAINAVRYTIRQSASGASNAAALVSALDKFTSESFSDEYTDTTGGTVFANEARKDINNWLTDSSITTPVIAALPSGFTGSPTAADHQQHAMSATDLAKMEPLRLSEELLAWTEYRSQQVEWRGTFDGHHYANTTDEILSDPSPKGHIIPNLAAPTPWDTTMYGGENFIFTFNTPDTSAQAAQNTSASETSIYDAMLTAVSTLYDDTDGSQTTGHRSNLYSPALDRIGYSTVINSLDPGTSPHAYVFTQTISNQELVLSTPAAIQAREQELAWVKTLWDDQTFRYLVDNGLGAKEFLIQAVGLKPNMGGANYLTWLDDWATTISLNAGNGDYATKDELLEASLTVQGTSDDGAGTVKEMMILHNTQGIYFWSDSIFIPGIADSNGNVTTFPGFDISALPRVSGYSDTGEAMTTVLPYDVLGSGTLSINIDGAEPQTTLDRLWSL